MSSFEEVWSQQEVGATVSVKLTVDGLEGTFKLRKTGEDSYTFKFCSAVFFNRVVEFAGPTVSLDQLKEEIEQIADSKVSMYQMLTAKEYDRYVVTQRFIYDKLGYTVPECYVCLGETFGHKTKCGHDICLQCFAKSVKDKLTFQCGVCREEETCVLPSYELNE